MLPGNLKVLVVFAFEMLGKSYHAGVLDFVGLWLAASPKSSHIFVVYTANPKHTEAPSTTHGTIQASLGPSDTNLWPKENPAKVPPPTSGFG